MAATEQKRAERPEASRDAKFGGCLLTRHRERTSTFMSHKSENGCAAYDDMETQGPRQRPWEEHGEVGAWSDTTAGQGAPQRGSG